MYRDVLTPRQVWARILALPYEAKVWADLRADAEKANAEAKEAEIEALLAKFQPSKEG